MRVVVCGLAAGLLACHAGAASAQQGVVQISGAGQTITGGTLQPGDNSFEPDFGVSWIQPGVRFGSFQLELRGAKRADRLHVGRNYAALRDLKRGAVSWSFEAGDAYFTRALGEYGFSNLTTAPVTFSGGAISARTNRGALHVVGGRATAWRNIFGTDPDTLAQTLGMIRGSYKMSDRLEVLGRISRIQTSSLREFSFDIADSRQAGGGFRFTLVPAVQLIADGSYVLYRRLDSNVQVPDGSYLTGASFLLPHGWVQVNVSRFSPGEFPAMNDPMHDRESTFAAGEYDVWTRATLFGGWEMVRINIDPDRTLPASANLPQQTAKRGFGGMRVRFGTRSNVTLRLEEGGRIARPVLGGLDSESDTGVRSLEWQVLAGPMTTYARIARRQNIDSRRTDATYSQNDLTGQLFLRVSRTTQLFSTLALTRHETGAAQGSTYWQLGGGAELQIAQRNLWARGEAMASRNVDLVTREFIPREVVNVGLNGQLRAGTGFSLNVSAYRTPFTTAEPSWTTRSMFRVTQNFSTGTARVIPAGMTAAAVSRARGTGQIVGTVFADWNANGLQDPDENPLENIPVRVSALSTVTTRRDGDFSFLNVPTGPQQIGLDVAAVPVDFDSPAVSMVDIDIDRGATRRVSFGLIPLGSVRGRVVRDANGNGKVDPGEEPIDGAVLVLDGGKRSEQARRGVFRFDSIRSGDHVVSLLSDSLPEGAVITGTAEVPLVLSRNQMSADVDFLVVIQKRPETRKVFPPRTGPGTPRPPAPAAAPTASPSARPGPAPAERTPAAPRPLQLPPSSTSQTPGYAVQIAALNDPLRARVLARDLTAAGYAAYVVAPGPEEVEGPYRVRVGRYRSRDAASGAATTLGKVLGEKLWVIAESTPQ
jgi:cell division septation protein DedD